MPTPHTLDLMDDFPRSQGTTKRSYWNPEGAKTKAVLLANILVMRVLYLSPGLKHVDCGVLVGKKRFLNTGMTKDLLCTSTWGILSD